MTGLTTGQVRERTKQGKVNISDHPNTRTYREIIRGNVFTFFNFLNVVLFALVLLVGSVRNGLFMMTAVINTMIGIIQEIRAKKTLDRLSIMTRQKVVVLRDGKHWSISTDRLVQDDIVFLKAGDQVPADSILLDGNMEVNESLLTGESDNLSRGKGDKLFSGSFVTSGQGWCRAVHVGSENYASRITHEAKEFRKHHSELRASIDAILKVISIIIVPLGVLLFYKQYVIQSASFRQAVVGMVAGVLGMVPEGLVLLTSIALTIGALKLAMKKTLIQELYCIETLARVDTLCLDKTGTLTSGEMEVEEIIPYPLWEGGWTETEQLSLQRMYLEANPESDTGMDGESPVMIGNLPEAGPELQLAGENGDAQFQAGPELQLTGENGDALLQAGPGLKLAGENGDALLQENSALQLTEENGDSLQQEESGSVLPEKNCSSLYENEDIPSELPEADSSGKFPDTGEMEGILSETTGIFAGEVPLNEIERILGNMMENLKDENATASALKKRFLPRKDMEAVYTIPFSSDRKYSGVSFREEGTFLIGAARFLFPQGEEKLFSMCQVFAEQGKRVLVLAHSPAVAENNGLPEKLAPVALITLSDLLRENVSATLEYFYEQGVELKVISGDDAVTVSTVAKAAGVKNAEKYVDASALNREELAKAVEEYNVFGRVTPQQKKDMVKALKARKHMVAMTGDGVNDVLALKEADCSIAMAAGSSAAKNIANVVLLSSDFAAMPDIVNQGRRVVNNIRTAASMFLIKTLFSVLLVLITIFWGESYPFEPIQMSLIGACAVGIPTFFLAQEDNFQRIDHTFLRHVFMNAFPAAAAISSCVVVIMLVCQNFYHSVYMLGTACFLVTGWNYMSALKTVYSPLTRYRKAVIYFMQIVFFAAAVAARNLLSLRPLEFELIILVFLLMSFTPLATDVITEWVRRVYVRFLDLEEDKWYHRFIAALLGRGPEE